MRDLAPMILRQRLVIEGLIETVITDIDIKNYLVKLSSELKMKTLIQPVTHRSDLYGWAGWIHWETSGAHFYAWERPVKFFSVDIYTCKQFETQWAVDFTQRFFEATQVQYKEF